MSQTEFFIFFFTPKAKQTFGLCTHLCRCDSAHIFLNTGFMTVHAFKWAYLHMKFAPKNYKHPFFLNLATTPCACKMNVHFCALQECAGFCASSCIWTKSYLSLQRWCMLVKLNILSHLLRVSGWVKSCFLSQQVRLSFGGNGYLLMFFIKR